MSGQIRIRSVERVGDAIRFARELAGLSQRQLANRTGYAQSQIGQWELGDHLPGSKALVRVFGVLGYDLALVPREDTSTRCSKCGGELTTCVNCGAPALCGEAHCQAHLPDGGWDAHPLSETYPGSGIYE